MKDFAGLDHLFVVSFLFYFSYMVIPAITDVTMEAVCPGRDECSVAIYLSGFQNAVSNRASHAFAAICLSSVAIHERLLQVTGVGALVVTPIVGNLSDRYGRKALMTLPVTMAIVPLCKWSVHHDLAPSFLMKIMRCL